MKRLLYLLLLCLTAATFTGCGVLRKTQKQDKQEAVQQSESVTGSLLQQIDSSRTSATEITYTKIEYYPPQPGNQQQDPKDETPKDRPAPQPAEAPGENGCPKLTAPVSNPVNAGAVKSIEQITVRTSSESKTEERQSRETCLHIEVPGAGRSCLICFKHIHRLLLGVSDIFYPSSIDAILFR